MKKTINLLAGILCILTMASCNDTDETFQPQTFDIQGKVEKGPFISGSDISIQPMDEKLQVLGGIYNTYITDDLGNFVLGSKKFQTPYAEFMANGYFFNEVKGELSNGTLTLRALVDLRSNTTANVNILTHLKYARIKNLVSQGKKFSEANTQAQKELLNEFGLGAYTANDASSFSIIAGTDESAALIVISSLLLMDRTEAALTEYLSKISSAFGANGKFTDEIKAQIKADKENLSNRLTKVRENIVSRYNNLGIDVTVKDLSHFIDWNNDGVAGNEILKENQTISLDKTSLEVPNEGGTYTIKINSPVTVFLEPQAETPTEILPPSTIIPEASFWNEIYEGYDESYFSDKNIGTETHLTGNTLEITVLPLQSKVDKNTHLYLYDYIGNIVASIEITQKGKIYDIPIAQIPQLGRNAQGVVASAFINLAQGLSYFNVIEQHYNHNRGTNALRANITPENGYISSAWSRLYSANHNLLLLKSEDETRLNVYGDYLNVLNALIYSNLVYGWGAVPYITDNKELENYQDFAREPQEAIFGHLKSNLSKAIKNLEEKRNESLKDINGCFFVSKDVARVLLANILMYEKNYNDALTLLQKVIDNGFYALDASTGFEPSVTTESVSAEESTEVIFALMNNTQTRANIVIREPGIIPYITLSDVYLSLAECHYRLGNHETTKECIDNVIKAKNLTIQNDDFITRIKEIREQILLHSGTYFAFVKRNGIAEEVFDLKIYQQHMQLFPIPENELYYNKNMTQNPGY